MRGIWFKSHHGHAVVFTGCVTLLEIYKVSLKFSGLVCAFVVNISYNSCISGCISTKYLDLSVNQDQLILRLVISVSVR